MVSYKPPYFGGVSGADAGGLDSFVLPMMLGSIGELRPLQFQTPDKHYGASITLIARRSTQRIGTRHWRRGADSQACHSSPLPPPLPLPTIYTSLLLILAAAAAAAPAAAAALLFVGSGLLPTSAAPAPPLHARDMVEIKRSPK